jgi:hypothetical protein
MAEAASVTLAGGLLGTVGAHVFCFVVDVWKHTQGFFPFFVVEPETIAHALSRQDPADRSRALR